MKANRPAPPKAIQIVRAFTARWGHPNQFIDWGEPACFACGYYQERWDHNPPWDEKQDGRTPWPVLNERWERSHLQKAHLSGFQFGGDNGPDNYAMLCRRCHIDSPDVPDAAVMVRWISQREPHCAALFREFTAACPDGLVERWVKAGSPTPDMESAMIRGGVHFDPLRGAGMSLSTLAAVAAESVAATLAKRTPDQMRLL